MGGSQHHSEEARHAWAECSHLWESQGLKEKQVTLQALLPMSATIQMTPFGSNSREASLEVPGLGNTAL